MIRRSVCRLFAAAALCVLPLAAGAKATNEIAIATQASFAVELRQIAKEFQSANPDIVVTVKEDEFGATIRSLEADEGSDIAVLDRAPAGAQYVDHTLEIAPYAIIVDATNRVAALTSAQVRDIYAGRIANWSQAGGANQAIAIVGRPAWSGTTALFAATFGASGAAGTIVDNTSPAVLEAVRTTPGAIGFVGLPYLRAMAGARTVAVDGTLPSPEAIAAGRYAFYAPVHAVTLGQPSQRISRFLAFAESRRELLHAAGFYSVFETKR